jgi:hypothetical protein
LTWQAHDSQQPHVSLHTREGRNAYKAGIDRLITQHVEQELAANGRGFLFHDDSSTEFRWTTPQPDTAGLSMG